jgi:hypothetical protein
MHYLTQYYKNRCEQLQEQINALNGKLFLLAEATVAGADDDASTASGQAGGMGFDGGYLGQLLGSGNMDAVNAYLAQFGQGGGPASRYAGAGVGSQGSQGGGGSEVGFDGSILGKLLASNNMDAVNAYLAQFGSGLNASQGSASSAPAMRSMLRAATNKAGSVRTGSSNEALGSIRGAGATPSDNNSNLGIYQRGSAASAGPDGYSQIGGGYGSESSSRGGYSGKDLGALLGGGNMDAVRNYLNQFGAKGGGNLADTGFGRKRRG